MRAYVAIDKEAEYVEAREKEGWRVLSRHPNTFLKCVILYLEKLDAPQEGVRG